MRVRPATDADAAGLRALWEEFETEVPEPAGFVPDTWEEEWAELRRAFAEGAVFVAEDDDELVGVAHVTPPEQGRAHVELVHVRPGRRRRGIAKQLLHECVHAVREKGATLITLEVLTANLHGRKPQIATSSPRVPKPVS